ncbi:MAG: hypothetical protein ACOCWM_02325 [Cyclobacteriaceae bacterium]
MKQINTNLAKLLALVEQAGTIEGRTKFQKIVYILKSKGINFNENFRYHYFGPYSADLHLEIEELTDRNMLIEKQSNPYIYKLNPSLSADRDPDILGKKELIDYLNSKDSRVLELTSTIFYLEQGGISDKSIIKKKLAALKPHLKEFIDKSFNLRDEIDKY